MEPRFDSPTRGMEFQSGPQGNLLLGWWLLLACSLPWYFSSRLRVVSASSLPLSPHSCGCIWVYSPSALQLLIDHSTEKKLYSHCRKLFSLAGVTQLCHKEQGPYCHFLHKECKAERDLTEGIHQTRGQGENSSPKFLSCAFIADFCQPSSHSKMKHVLFCDRKSIAHE